MTSSPSTEFTAGDGRSFGLQLGLALFALAGFLLWRDHPLAAAVLAALGGSLLLAGWIRPIALRPVHRRWMALASWISKFTTPVFLGVVYFLVLTPTGLAMRALGRRPIDHEPGPDGGYWVRRDPDRPGDMRRQF